MDFDFSEVLRRMVEVRASDVHLTAGFPPAIRENGRITPMEGFPVLTGQETREVVYGILNDDQRKRFENNKQLDFAYAIPGVARFRVNCFFQRGTVSAAFRLVPQDIPALESLGVPEVLRDLTRKPRGFVLVTGPTGSGKSTTLAAMIDLINESARITSSPSRTRSSSCTSTNARSSTSARSAPTPPTSPSACAPRCERTPT